MSVFTRDPVGRRTHTQPASQHGEPFADVEIARQMLWSVASILFSTCIQLTQGWSLPPFMTNEQMVFMKLLHTTSVNQSEAATQKLLARLDQDDFRSYLQRISPVEVYSASSQQLLESLQEAAQVAEFVHGFPSLLENPDAYSPSVDMALLSELQFLPNMWQLVTMFPSKETADYYQLLMYLAPCGATEVKGWHLPDFTGQIPVQVPGDSTPWPGGYPADILEASQRAVYTVFNLNRLDAPTELYGDVALVLNRSSINNAVAITSFDSGDFSICCDVEFSSSFCARWNGNVSACKEFWYCEFVGDGQCVRNETLLSGRNCEDINDRFRHLGTPNELNHLFTPFADYYGADYSANRLASLVAGALTSWSSPSILNQTFTGGFSRYLEANIFASAELHVNMVLASFPKLFGSIQGNYVMKVAAKRGWLVAWTLGSSLARGDVMPPNEASWQSIHRIIDPRNMLQHYNVSIVPSGSFQQMDSLWNQVKSMRTHGDFDNASTFQHYWELAQNIASPSLRVQPLLPRACIDTNRCFALEYSSLKCICRTT